MKEKKMGSKENKIIQENTSLNDVHSQLNETIALQVIDIRDQSDIVEAIRCCKEKGRKIAICGAKGAMGGQQFAEGAVHLNFKTYNNVLELNSIEGFIKVEAGINWTQMVAWLNTTPLNVDQAWGIRQKQTGADFMTLGGSVSANAHGRGLGFAPIIEDVASFELVTSNGDVINCSRSKNAHLFSLVAGGYGLFGCISTVTLKLSKRQRLVRHVEVTEIDSLPAKFEEKIEEGYLYGDFQFSCDETSEDLLKKGVFSTYLPVEDLQKIYDDSGNYKLNTNMWKELLYLAHVDKSKAFKLYSQFYMTTNNQLYWTDTHQLSVYIDDYHMDLDIKMKSHNKCSEMICEFYVEKENLNKFLERSRAYIRANGVDLIYGTVRTIKQDKTSYLPWAKKDYICIIFNLHVEHSKDCLEKAKIDFQNIIEITLNLGGNYFLTYHRWAKKDQVVKAYPQFIDFLRLKREFDPEELFVSDWYFHYKEMFKKELSNEK